MRRRYLATATLYVVNLVYFCVAPKASAKLADCPPPTPQKLVELSSYISKRYGFSSLGRLTLTDSQQANESCFWRLHYQDQSESADHSSWNKTELTLYLSPDQRYLLPELFDLKSDPNAESKLRASERMKLLLENDPPSRGRADAPVTIVEFSDFECPYCKQFAQTIEKDLTASEKGKIRLVFREFPLSMHPWAKQAAEIASCAALQNDDSFWTMHAFLFGNQSRFSSANLMQTVDEFLGSNSVVDKTSLDRCIDKKLAVGGIEEDVRLGLQAGVHSTPTLFINGVEYDGGRNAVQLREIISRITEPQ